MEIINKYFVDIIKSKNDLIIFEFGTHNGYHTNLMVEELKKLNRDFKYYAFEPDPRRIEEFKYILGKNIQYVSFIQSAIGQINGKVKFYLSGGIENREGYAKQSFSGSSSIRSPKLVTEAWPDMTFNETVVDCWRLDDFCKIKGISHIDFIWADIQGAEVDLILGANDMLKNIHYLYTEYCNSELYDGEINLQQICSMLPLWEVVKDFNGDVLLKNKYYDYGNTI